MDTTDRLIDTHSQALLTRAARVAGTAVSVHGCGEDGETDSLFQCGACAEACAHVSGLPWGKQACKRSREDAAADALRRRRPVPFLCHMGFSCVAVSAPLNAQEKFVITFGPYCPAEAPDSLEVDAREGLARLARDASGDLPFGLADIPLVSADAMPEIAQWTAETLASHTGPQPAPADDSGPVSSEAGHATARNTRRSTRAVRDPYQAGAIVAALSAGDQDRARAVVRRLIEDTPSRKRVSTRARRARTLAVTAAVLEAAERAGLDTAEALAKYATLPASVERAEDSRTLALASMKVLGPLKRSALKDDFEEGTFARLNELLDSRLAEGITLGEIGERLGQHPTTLTRRLQRAYGMSYSQYLGRRRVDAAMDLLKRTRLSVADVALRVGLNDASNLNKLFRKFEGVSPSEYRKRHGRGGSARRTGTHR